MKNKVYVVTTGEYSDYQIDRIFTSLDKAEQYVAANSAYLDEYSIETYDVDNVDVDVNKDEMGYCYYNSYRLMMTPMLKSRFVKIKEKHEKEYKDIKSNFDVYKVSYIIAHQNAFFEGVWLPEKNKEKAKKMLADIESKNKAIKEGIT